jgi:hypothetical protein
MKQRDKPPMRKIIKRILLVIIAVFILLITTILFMVYWQGSTKDISAEADNFKTPPSWTLTREQIDPPRILCISDIPCPYVSRTWKIPGQITYNELTRLLDATKWNYDMHDTCKHVDTAREIAVRDNNYYSCSISAESNGYTMSLYIQTADRNPNEVEATLSLKSK